MLTRLSLLFLTLAVFAQNVDRLRSTIGRVVETLQTTRTCPFNSAGIAQFKFDSDAKPSRITVNKYAQVPCANTARWSNAAYKRDLEHTLIIYGTKAKTAYDITASVNCAPVTNPVYDTFVATLSNAPAGTTGYVIGSEGISAASSGSMVSDYNVPQGTTRDFMVGATSATAILRASFLRGVAFSGNVTRNVDLAASGFDLGTQTLDVAPAISTTLANVYYVTTPSATLGLELLRAPTINAGTGHVSGSFATVPSANQASGDMYLVDVEDSSPTASHRLLRRFHSAANVSGTMPPDLVATVTIGATTPYLRPHCVLTQRVGAAFYTDSWYYTPSKGVSHNFGTQIEAPYLSGTGQATVDFPDLSGVSGWNAAWGAPSAAAAGSVGTSIGVTIITDAAGVHEESSAAKSGQLP